MRRALLIAVLALPLLGAAPKGQTVADAARQRAMDRDESRAQAKTAADEIARLRQELTALGAAETKGERQVGDRGARLAALNAAEADLSARMGKNQAALSRLLGALQLYRRDPPPALLVSPRSATDAVNAAILMKSVTPELERRAKAFAAEAKQLQTLRRNVVLANGALFAAQSDVADRRAQIERLIGEKVALEHRLDTDADHADADVKRLAAEAKSLGQLVSGLDSREPEAGGANALHLTAPVQAALIRRFNDPWPGQARSEGWSWRPAPGALVFSPADGRIDYAGPLKGWGLVLILRVAGGYHLVLAGLETADGRIGSEVSAGEPIGHMAATSAVSKDKAVAAPELYLEVRRGDTPVDPAHWLEGSTARGGR
jgi:septal ring factor EnvC (AmiA/AmiB activator)